MCLNPVLIKLNSREVSSGLYGNDEKRSVSCGNCIECVNSYIRDWTIRWKEEIYDKDKLGLKFLTLTYNNENLPINELGISTLNHLDVQKFLKKLRVYQERKLKIKNKILYHICGEYGTNGTKRPHYHLLLVNCFCDASELSKIWNKGLIHLGNNVDENSVSYILKYQLKSKLSNNSFYNEKNYYRIYKNKKTGELNKILNYKWRNKVNKEVYKYIKTININDCRVKEYSICSKGIGKGYLDRININKILKNIDNSYHFLTDKKNFFCKLPRFFEEKIFNKILCYSEKYIKFVSLNFDKFSFIEGLKSPFKKYLRVSDVYDIDEGLNKYRCDLIRKKQLFLKNKNLKCYDKHINNPIDSINEIKSNKYKIYLKTKYYLDNIEKNEPFEFCL